MIGVLGVVVVAAAILMERPIQDKDPAVFQTLRRWISLTYVPLAKESINISVADVPVFLFGTTNLSLVSSARSAASLFLLAFSSGDYADYEKFRFPAPAFLIRSNYMALKNELSDPKSSGMLLSPPPVWAIDTNYVMAHSNIWPPRVAPPPRFPAARLNETNFNRLLVEYHSQGTWYEGYFQSFCPSNSYIAIQTTRKSPEPLEALVRREENMGLVISGTPYYRFKRSPEDILQQDKQLIIVTCKLLIKLRAPDTVVPHYIRYYYDPENATLLPFQYVVGNGMIATYTSTWF